MNVYIIYPLRRPPSRNADLRYSQDESYLNCTRCATALFRIDEISTSAPLQPLGIEMFLLFAEKEGAILFKASEVKRSVGLGE